MRSGESIERRKKVNLVYFSPETAAALRWPAEYAPGAAFADFRQAAAEPAADPVDEALAGQGKGSLAGAGELWLVNCLNFYRRLPLWKREPEKLLLKGLTELREAAGAAEIKLLLPTEKNQDAGLVVELVGQGFYDFWFADTLDEAGLARILGERRGFRELDAYLSSLPRPEILSRQEEKGWLREGQRWLAGWSERLSLKEAALGGSTPVDRREEETASNEALLDREASRAAESQSPAREGAARADPDSAEAPAVLAAARTEAREGARLLDFRRTREKERGTFSGLSGGLGRVFGRQSSIRRSLKQQRESGPFGESEGRVLPVESPGRLGTTALFYGEDDSMLVYASALLTAFQLSERGAPVLVVELPGSGSRLGSALGLRHPGRNLRCLLERLSRGGQVELDRCCFTGPDYARDEASFDLASPAASYPECLWFLPDDCTPAEASGACWERFCAELLTWALLEKGFPYIFYVGFGPTALQIAGAKPPGRFVCFAAQPWPASFQRYFQLRKLWSGGSVFLYGEEGKEAVARELKEKKTSLIVPRAAIDEFVRLSFFERKKGGFCREAEDLAAGLRQLLSRGG